MTELMEDFYVKERTMENSYIRKNELANVFPTIANKAEER